MKKSQTLSVDLMIAATIIVGILIVFLISLTYRIRSLDEEEIKNEADIIVKRLTQSNSENAIILEGSLDLNRTSNLTLEVIKGYYEEVKKALGIKSDFCIFFVDNNNSVYPIIINSTHVAYGIGDKKVKLNGTIYCGEGIKP